MTQIPAGWYADPDPAAARPGHPPQQRYWDGAMWTEHVAPGQPVAATGAFKTTPDGERLANWWPRVGASVIDGLIVTPVVLVLGLPFLLSYVRSYTAYMEELTRTIEAGGTPGFAAGTTVGAGDLVALTLVGLIVGVTYNAAFLRRKGATPGKMVLGLRVRLRDTPGQLPWSAIARRLLVQQGASLFAVVPFASLLVGWFPLLDGLWPLWDSKNQALHDKLARTNVVVRSPQA